MTKPLADMGFSELLSRYRITCAYPEMPNLQLEVRAELERRIDSKPPVATPKPLSAMSIGELLYEYRNGWDVGMRGGLQRGHDIRCEVERRVHPAPVPSNPIERMTFDELILDYARHCSECNPR